MEKIVCPGCGAGITPSTTQAFLVCEYCDTSVPNPFYVESEAAEAAKPSLEELCVSTLVEMGASAGLREMDEYCFGTPLLNGDEIRGALSISDNDKLYLVMRHLSLLGVKDGIALTSAGVYTKYDGQVSRMSWESFITGSIACVDRAGWTEPGTLAIGSSIEIPVSSENDSRLARFLVDFHNRVYLEHTGSAAPESWRVTEQAQQEAEAEAAPAASSSLAGTVLTAATALLGRKLLQNQSHSSRPVVTSRPAKIHPIHKPAARPQRPAQHARPTMARPAQSGRPAQPGRPAGGPGRPAGGPGRPGPGGRGGMGGPGRPGRR